MLDGLSLCLVDYNLYRSKEVREKKWKIGLMARICPLLERHWLCDM